MLIRTITVENYEKLCDFWKANYFVSEMDNKDYFMLFLEKNPNLSVLAKEDLRRWLKNPEIFNGTIKISSNAAENSKD